MKRLLVIASGETERRALPALMRDTLTNIELLGVRIPPGHRDIARAEVAEAVIRAAFWQFKGEERAPDKVVVLIDADAAAEQGHHKARELQARLEKRLASLPTKVLVAAACRHLEAWFFADAQGLREFLGRALGNVDPLLPDEIENPKLYLTHLLRPRVYVAAVAGEIARRLSPAEVRRSSSFVAFEAAARNGGGSTEPNVGPSSA